jgi:glycosyltransferase involved in cell wall biosynthesis
MSSRRVLVDAYNLAMPTGTGIATYTRTLCAALRDMGHAVELLYGPASLPADSLLREMEFFQTPAAPRLGPVTLASVWRRMRQIAATGRGVTAVPVELSGRVERRHFADRLPPCDRIWAAANVYELARVHFVVTGRLLELRLPAPPDVVHWTSPLPLRVVGARNVYTLHDLVPLRLLHTTGGNKARTLALHRAIAASGDAILTVSETSRRDIIDFLDVPPEWVCNTFQGIDVPDDAAMRPIAEVHRDIAASLGLPGGAYLLFFGAIEPKKNLARLIRAYLRSGVRIPLVVVGKFAWMYDEEERLLNDPELRFRASLVGTPQPGWGLRHLGHVPRAQLIELVRGAKAVLFPSLYEGFGLPAAEAMQLGTPVLASREGALPEICGDAAVLVDAYDIDDMADAIRRIDADAALRRQCSERGVARAALFSPAAFRDRLSAFHASLGKTPCDSF